MTIKHARFMDHTLPVDQRVEDLLAQMTLDEKVAQLGSCWIYELLDGLTFSERKAATILQYGLGHITRTGGASDLSPRQSADINNAMQKYVIERTRLGIPLIIHEECCSGYMARGATVFPQAIGVAVAELHELVASRIARHAADVDLQARQRGCNAFRDGRPVFKLEAEGAERHGAFRRAQLQLPKADRREARNDFQDLLRRGVAGLARTQRIHEKVERTAIGEALDLEPAGKDLRRIPPVHPPHGTAAVVQQTRQPPSRSCLAGISGAWSLGEGGRRRSDRCQERCFEGVRAVGPPPGA